ncbi:hypothetical protein [Geodermatophilus sp. SYSU D00684]
MRRPEVHVFAIWSEARVLEERILEDLAGTFTVLEVVEVSWTPGETFARNLTRMYGDALPPGSDKEVHCGSGPFLLVVVRDDRPRHRLRRTTRGPALLNSTVFDARARYREWTGGGYRVHASDSAAEAARNLALLLGRRVSDVPGHDPRTGVVHSRAGDPVGTHGWESVDQLVLALEAHGCSPTHRSTGPDGDRLVVRTPDAWWAERIAGGTEVTAGARDVPVASGTVRLVLVEEPPRRRPDWVGTARPWVRRARRLRDTLRPAG